MSRRIYIANALKALYYLKYERDLLSNGNTRKTILNMYKEYAVGQIKTNVWH